MIAPKVSLSIKIYVKDEEEKKDFEEKIRSGEHEIYFPYEIIISDRDSEEEHQTILPLTYSYD